MATAAAATETRAGQRIGNRFRLHSLVQEEAASDLYSGVDETNRSKVWVRVLRDEYAMQPKVVDHFAELPRQLMRQQGPGLPRVLAVGSDASGVPYTVWEHLSGQTLAELLAGTDTALTFERAMEFMAPVLDAVSKLHALDKAHGELHPDAILLADTDKGTQPTLLHVGRPRDKTSDSAYSAPELSGAEPHAESDVYSLGMIFYRLLSGRTLGRKDTTALREAAPDVPEEVAALIESCLADDPDARPPNALELLARAEKLQKQLRSRTSTPKPKPSKPRPASLPDEPAPKRRAKKRKKKAGGAVNGAKVSDAGRGAAAPAPRPEPQTPPSETKAAAAVNARRDLVADALARAKKDAPKDIDRPGPKDSESAAVIAAREATVAEALAKAKAKKAPASEAKPAAQDDAAHNTHLYQHLWARKEKAKRNPVYTYGEAALFALFAWFLMRMTPTLTNPNLTEVEGVLGPEFKVVGVVMAASSVVVVGRMFALQAKVFGSMLKPVVMSMGGTAMCITVAVTAPFASEGILQPLQALARQGLAWFSGASFAMGGLFLARWGIAQLASQGAAVAASSFAGSFMFVLSSGGMLMHGVALPREVIDFSTDAEAELAVEDELEEGEIGPDGAKKVSLKVNGNLKDEASRLAKRKRAPGDPLDEASVEAWEGDQGGTVEINQRTESGSGDEGAETGVDQLRSVRQDNAATMKGIQKAAKAKLSFSE